MNMELKDLARMYAFKLKPVAEFVENCSCTTELKIAPESMMRSGNYYMIDEYGRINSVYITREQETFTSDHCITAKRGDNVFLALPQGKHHEMSETIELAVESLMYILRTQIKMAPRPSPFSAVEFCSRCGKFWDSETDCKCMEDK